MNAEQVKDKQISSLAAELTTARLHIENMLDVIYQSAARGENGAIDPLKKEINDANLWLENKDIGADVLDQMDQIAADLSSYRGREIARNEGIRACYSGHTFESRQYLSDKVFEAAWCDGFNYAAKEVESRRGFDEMKQRFTILGYLTGNFCNLIDKFMETCDKHKVAIPKESENILEEAKPFYDQIAKLLPILTQEENTNDKK